MIRSMTGYGLAEGTCSYGTIKVEIRSLNNRYFEFSSRVPSLLFSLEDDIKKIVREDMQRGKINLLISIDHADDMRRRVMIDENKIEVYIKKMRSMGKKFGVAGDLVLSDIIHFPDIFVSDQEQMDQGTLKKALLPILKKALESIVAMKMKEGASLVKDMFLRIEKVRSNVEEIERLSQKEPELYKKQLKKRIETLADDVKITPERIAEEIVFFADKCDITEELVRLKSHIVLFIDVLKGDGESGKKLDFIIQEIQRESNTISSKSSRSEVAQKVITIKLELEKLKEQIQNIE
jgi:uncharacterized protein (TIGR00255 family)